MDDEFEPIIGLEVHVELKTKSKMFCGCDANYFGHEPNTHCCPVCLGLPGALPVPNRKAVEWCVMLGLALNCEIPEFSKFDRKNYYYPDLPKGYQISQYDKPFAINGYLVIPSERSESRNLPHVRLIKEIPRLRPVERDFVRDDRTKTIRIRRVHMEEDTGKLLHATIDDPTSPSGLRGVKEKCTLIDFNRSGVPLVEIVTEPDIRSSEEARIFLKKLYQIIRYLGISDADMEKGSMRLEPNISIRIKNQELRIKNKQYNEINKLPNYKVEVKNINSFNFAKKAIDYEIERQIELLRRGETPRQETRGWDEKKGITYSQRSKEEAHDYRYFPEPDIPPIRWKEAQIISLKSQISELPDKKLNRFMKEYGLSEYDASILTETREVADYYAKAVELGMKNKNITPKIIANWIINKKADIAKIAPEELIKLISAQQQRFTGSDKEITIAVKKILSQNPKAVNDYKSGKTNAIMFLVGLVMKELKGQADPEKVKKLIEQFIVKYNHHGSTS